VNSDPTTARHPLEQPVPSEMARYLESTSPSSGCGSAPPRRTANTPSRLRLALLKQTYRLDADATQNWPPGPPPRQALGLAARSPSTKPARRWGQRRVVLRPGRGAHRAVRAADRHANSGEMQAVFGHELGALPALAARGGRYPVVAERLLAGIDGEPRASASHQESADGSGCSPRSSPTAAPSQRLRISPRVAALVKGNRPP